MNKVNFGQDFEIFNNENLGSVRAIKDEAGEVWVVAKDVCDILGIKNVSDAMNRIDPEDRSYVKTTTLGLTESREDGNNEQQKQKAGLITTLSLISKAGLYELVIGSRKPQARPFVKWITNSVLPSIEQHGGYVYGQEALSKNTQLALHSELEKMSDKVTELTSHLDRTKRLWHDRVAESKELKVRVSEQKTELKQLSYYLQGLSEDYDQLAQTLEKESTYNGELRQELDVLKYPEAARADAQAKAEAFQKEQEAYESSKVTVDEYGFVR